MAHHLYELGHQVEVVNPSRPKSLLMPSLLLIPGLLCDERLWNAQVAALRDSADVTVADITEQSSITSMAAAILEEAPQRFSLVGFSLGSQVALEIMRVAKERVDRLALLSATHGGLLPHVETSVRQAIATIEQGRFDQYLEAAYPTYVAPCRVDDVRLKAVFVEMAHAAGADAALRQMRALLAIAIPFRDLDRICCPTVIVGGREDRRTTPAAHEVLAREIPGSELVLVEASGHFTPLEQPALVVKILERLMTL